MQYISTRNDLKDLRKEIQNNVSTSDNFLNAVDSAYAVVKGLAEDGGLFVPRTFPTFDLERIIGKNYQEVAFEILKIFFDDFDENSQKKIIKDSYNIKNFETEAIAEIKSFDSISFLELYHGKTCAFKDFALSIFPYLLKESANKLGIKDKIVILTATSGDTGKAVLEAFSEIEGIEVVVFYPQDGVSYLQKLQMVSSSGKNLHVIAIEGNFDDAQRVVKQIFIDEEFNNKMRSKGIIFTSANSINIGRLIPQIIYYFYTYVNLIENKKINRNEKINFVVPTGNFGNILACYYAKKMGLPIETIICASNSNNILYDFFTTGKMDLNRQFYKTISPSMDILISSNFERFLFDITDQNFEIINKYKNGINKNYFELDRENINKINGFYSSFATDIETISSINKVYNKYNYLIDPHTAVAYKVYEDYIKFCKDFGCEDLANKRTVIVSTASPFKFPKVCLEAIGGFSYAINRFNELELAFLLAQKTGLNIPKPIENLKNLPVLHNIYVKKEDVKGFLENILC